MVEIFLTNSVSYQSLRVSSPCEYSFNPTVNADNDPARAVDVRFDPVFLALVLRLSRNGRTTTFSRFGEFGERRPSAFEVRIRRSCSGLSCCHFLAKRNWEGQPKVGQGTRRRRHYVPGSEGNKRCLEDRSIALRDYTRNPLSGF